MRISNDQWRANAYGILNIIAEMIEEDVPVTYRSVLARTNLSPNSTQSVQKYMAFLEQQGKITITRYGERRQMRIELTDENPK